MVGGSTRKEKKKKRSLTPVVGKGGKYIFGVKTRRGRVPEEVSRGGGGNNVAVRVEQTRKHKVVEKTKWTNLRKQ